MFENFKICPWSHTVVVALVTNIADPRKYEEPKQQSVSFCISLDQNSGKNDPLHGN